MNEFERKVIRHDDGALYSRDLEIIQINIGLKCNQGCSHCHLSASPARVEMMDRETMDLVVDAARKAGPRLIDVTGGSPEIHPHFRSFIDSLSEVGSELQVRTNLTILLEPEFSDLPAFLSERGIGLVASLPCYLEENVDSQRGHGAYRKSIEALKKLNSFGYGLEDHLPVNLVYNPIGPFLPPNQLALEEDYKRELETRWGIRFNRLITITNMPMGRFLNFLENQGKDAEYRELLVDSFNPAALEGLMCRHQVSIGWDGRLYDCDFNLALDFPVAAEGTGNVMDFDRDLLVGRRIITGPHCFGCTAGYGSSCAGALVEEV